MKQLNPHVSVDCVVFGFDGMSLRVLLINSGINSNTKTVKCKLPGSLVFDDEDLSDAASRVLFELTGLSNIFLQQFQAFGSPERLSNKADLTWLQQTTHLEIKRVVTVAFYSLIKIDKSKDDERFEWFDVNNLPELTFDHRDIIFRALDRVRMEFMHEPIEFELLPKCFTIRQLQNLHEVIFNQQFEIL